MNIRIVFTYFSFLLFAQRTNAQVIGSIDCQGNATLTFSEAKILDSWNQMLEPAAIKVKLNKVSIAKSADHYLLVATGNGYCSTALLTLDPAGQLILATTNGNKTTCTVKIISKCKGCEPQDGGYCNPCNTGKKDCIKSSSNAIELF